MRHAASEGFVERDVVMALLHGRELARYLHDRRRLAELLRHDRVAVAVRRTGPAPDAERD